jgi:hypothetical protein
MPHGMSFAGPLYRPRSLKYASWSLLGLRPLNEPEKNMTQFAMITGRVTYTPGDGVPIEIPCGRIEVDLAFDSATLSWEAGKETAGVAAIPRTAFDEYVEEGKITLE